MSDNPPHTQRDDARSAQSNPSGGADLAHQPNCLINETSPYLLQHAYNPVDWYAWGPEALQQARELDKPILLSIGYSACHWCHVMERESFEDEAMARLMNDLFVNIKVDREERPDLDSIYMQAVQALTQHGGWPMTVFLTPDGEPFYGGTYFPPVDRYGMPSFQRVLQSVAQAYREQRDAVDRTAQQLTTLLRRSAVDVRSPDDDAALPTATVLNQATQTLAAAFDTHDRVIHEMEANGFNPESDVELSIRERECLAWTLEGKTAGEIATILNLSVSTVNHHASSASHKLGTLNKHHAAVKALRTGLVQ